MGIGEPPRHRAMSIHFSHEEVFDLQNKLGELANHKAVHQRQVDALHDQHQREIEHERHCRLTQSGQLAEALHQVRPTMPPETGNGSTWTRATFSNAPVAGAGRQRANHLPRGIPRAGAQPPPPRIPGLGGS